MQIYKKEFQSVCVCVCVYETLICNHANNDSIDLSFLSVTCFQVALLEFFLYRYLDSISGLKVNKIATNAVISICFWSLAMGNA